MKTANIPRFMIVGTGSGSGKTTITCALLKAMQNHGLKLSSFKCGPDYIDPMFHKKVIGTKSTNLDLYMCSENTVRYLFAQNSKGSDISLIEGVMGMYDGLMATSDKCSSNDLSLLTDTPQILVVDAKGMSLSIVAQIFGYLNFRKNNIKGIILNRTTAGMYPIFKQMIENELPVKVYGYLPVVNEAEFKSRHLGLITAQEIQDINQKLDMLAQVCETTIDIDGLIELSKTSENFEYEEIEVLNIMEQKKVRIAVAMDKAFCFYYEDNLTLLKKLGAEIVYFSPLDDKRIPANIDGLILGGGYPEEYAKALSENKSMLDSIKTVIKNGIPLIAECGGYMYLCKSIADTKGVDYNMVGAIDATSSMTKKLSRFGYIKLIAKKDNLLCKKGESINAHEFHYSNSSDNGSDFTARKQSGIEWSCIHTNENMFVGYPHLHFWGNIDFAKNFVLRCLKHQQEK